MSKRHVIDDTDATLVVPVLQYGRIEFDYSLGTSIIVSALRSLNFNADHTVASGRTAFSDAIQQIIAKRTRLVGIQCYDAAFHSVRCFVARLRQTGYKGLIVIGGPAAAFSWGAILQAMPEVDFVVRGDGEEPMAALCCNSEAVHKLPGLAYRTGAGKRVSNERSFARSSMLDTPSPVLTGCIPPERAAAIGVMLSRGCNARCMFCEFAALNYHVVRSYTAERVYSELAHIAGLLPNSNSRRISFVDDSFLANRPEALKLCEMLVKNPLPFTYFAQMRVDQLNGEVIRLLRAAGFDCVAMGLESASPRILRVTKKTLRYPQSCTFGQRVVATVRDLENVGIKPVVSAIIGFPFESEAESRETITFIKRMGLREGSVALNVFHLSCGTELYMQRRQFGIRATTRWRRRIDSIQGTSVPAHVFTMPALRESIDFLKKRMASQLLRKRLFSVLWNGYSEDDEFVFADDASSFRDDVHSAEGKLVYVVARSERAVRQVSSAIERWCIASRVPIAGIQEVVVLSGKVAAKRPVRRSYNIGDMFRPLLVRQHICEESSMRTATKVLESCNELDIGLMVCGSSRLSELLVGVGVARMREKNLVISPFPLI